MIHYHGTPVGGQRVDAARFLRARHALIPYAYPADVEIAAEVCQSFIFDNSEFTYSELSRSKQKAPPLEDRLTGYVRLCAQWARHPGYDGCLITDPLDATEEMLDRLIEEFPKDLRGIPVWHLHESLDRLARLCDEWPTVALGSSGRWSQPGTEGWWRRMAQAMEVACDEEGRPLCRLHGLRMLDPEIFTRLPLASADSTNAAVNSGSLSRFGSYRPPTAAQRAEVIASRIEAHNSAPVWTGSGQAEMFELRAVNK